MGADRPRQHRRYRCRLGALVLGVVIAAPFAAAACEVREQTHRSGRVLCTIDGDIAGAIVRFEARFGGFHDDSVAAMTLRLDGADVACGAQDRTALSGESGDEGEVLLFCRLRVAPVEGRTRVLEGLLRFDHAELAGVRLVQDVAPDR